MHQPAHALTLSGVMWRLKFQSTSRSIYYWFLLPILLQNKPMEPSQLFHALPVEAITLILKFFCQDLTERYEKILLLLLQHLDQNPDEPAARSLAEKLGKPLSDYVNIRLVCLLFNKIVKAVEVEYHDVQFHSDDMIKAETLVELALQCLQEDFREEFVDRKADLRHFCQFCSRIRVGYRWEYFRELLY